MIKPSKVVFISAELERNFNQLKSSDPIKKSIIRAICDLRQNAFAGIQVPKRLIPKTYIRKFCINNLWKYDLPKGWRLLYTITPENEIELISAILEWFDHKGYEQRFNY
jgi:Txe/YoeB family toxin of Txe-Axe toxin-antitoxin module